MNMKPDFRNYKQAVDPKAVAFLSRPLGHFINNAFVPPEGKMIDVFDPATGKAIAQIPDGTAADVNRAVAAARAALEGPWGKMHPADRERLLLRLADLIDASNEELAQLETLNQGKSIHIARGPEVGDTARWCRYMAGWATKIEGSTIDVSIPVPPGARYRTMTIREPLGVVGAIIPWNFPLSMAMWKISPALACGCTIVLKPAEETPITALRLAELCAEAGLPPGVVNVVTGHGETTGAALSRHPGIDKIAFTGSNATGKIIAHAAIENMTRFSLELGGKSPVVVLEDTAADVAIDGASGAIFFNQGQVCTAGSRLYVHKSKFDNVVSGLASAANGMKIGAGLDPDTQINPLVSAHHRDRVQNFVNRGLEAGGRAVTDVSKYDSPGYFVRPTVLVDVDHRMEVVREEIFGPVVVAMPYSDLDEVTGLANDTDYGLSASIWSNDLKRVFDTIPKVKAGTVWVNCHNMVDPNMPFGGYKHSGYGREHGRSMVEQYTELKSVCIQY